jgi:hypothetical protein
MEPVKMKAPMPQLDTPSSQHEDADAKYSSHGDATEHEFHETINESPSEEAAEPKVEVKAGGRKRRRASSSGIITA